MTKKRADTHAEKYRLRVTEELGHIQVCPYKKKYLGIILQQNQDRWIVIFLGYCSNEFQAKKPGHTEGIP